MKLFKNLASALSVVLVCTGVYLVPSAGQEAQAWGDLPAGQEAAKIFQRCQ